MKYIFLIFAFLFKFFTGYSIDENHTFDIQKNKIKINLKNFHTLEKCRPDYIEKTDKEKEQVNPVEIRKPTEIEEKVYRDYLNKKLISNKISKSTADLITKNAKYIERSIQKRKEQPELTKTFQYYRDTIYKINDPETIKNIIIFYNKNKELIDEIEEVFLVDKEILLTICYLETRLGKITGSTRLIDAFFTMSISGVRKNFFEESMINFAKLVDLGTLEFDTKGSWDGGYGFTQFMPESILKYGISYSSNGKINLLDVADSFASTAHYLFEKGWHYKNKTLLEMKPKSDIDKCLIGFNKTNNIENWAQIEEFKDVIEFEGLEIDKEKEFTIIMPDLRNDSVEFKDVFLTFENFKVLLSYNKSIFYATAASLLYDKLKLELNNS